MQQSMQMWLNPRDLPQLSGPPRLRLFCLPHAGSGAAAFYRWKRLLPASIAVCPVLLPGRDTRLGEPPMISATTLVEHLFRATAPALTAPYAIFGHSMGALLAWHWTVRISRAGLPPPVVLFVSGREAPHLASRHSAMHRLPDAEFLAALRSRYGGLPPAFLDDPEMRSVFLPVLRADFQVVETCAPSASVQLECPIEVCAGATDTSVLDEGLERWRELSAGGVSVQRFAGDHFYHLNTGESALIAHIAARLRSEAPDTIAG